MAGFRLLILQIGTILIVARLVGWLFGKLHQPRVVGEMVAGILLGPSLLGWLAPNVSADLFPPASLGHLNSLSQVGLLIFMFLVGLELDLRQLRTLGRAAVMTSQVSIIAPFILGSLFAIYLYPRLSDPSVSFGGFALFMGAAMRRHRISGSCSHSHRTQHASHESWVRRDHLRRRRRCHCLVHSGRHHRHSALFKSRTPSMVDVERARSICLSDVVHC